MEELRKITATALPDDLLTFHIETANLLRTEKLVETGMSSERLDRIELYLAAHFASVSDPLVMSESVGGTSVTYALKIGGGLESSHFGQTAKMLDESGVLSLESKRVSLEVL